MVGIQARLLFEWYWHRCNPCFTSSFCFSSCFGLISSSSFLTSLSHHFFKFYVVFMVFFISFFSDKITLLSLSFDTASVIGFGMTTILFKYWSIIKVSKLCNLSNYSFSIACNEFAFGDLVVLHIEHFQLWHFYKNFINNCWTVNFVSLKVKTSQCWTF